MIRGIELISNTDTGVLQQVLKEIDLSQYMWTSENFEGYSSMSANGCDTRFSSFMLGESFQKRAFSDPQYSVLFAEFKGFAKNGKISSVTTYEEYLHSDCQIIILIADGDCIDIYAKDRDLCKTIYSNSLKIHNFKSLIFKTDHNDERSKMSVW